LVVAHSPYPQVMITFADRSLLRWAVIGDVAVLAALTVVGFATHSTLDETWRLVVTTLGVLAAWALVAPWFGVFSTEVLTRPAAVWRVAWAWAIAAPVAGFLRAWVLGVTVSPTFILVTIAVNGSGLVAWRAVYASIQRRRG
jgi:hypothetical protein